MGSERCDACKRSVSIGGGIAGIWNVDPTPTDGMTISFDEGDEYFLCFDCLEDLPEDATRADVVALIDRES